MGGTKYEELNGREVERPYWFVYMPSYSLYIYWFFFKNVNMIKKLNFGCGVDLKKGWDNVDRKHFDFNVFPYPIEDNIYKKVYIRNVLEYLESPHKVLNEIHRICQNKAIVEIRTPHFSNKGAYNSLQHTHYWSDKAFYYYIKGHKGMSSSNKFNLLSLKLVPTFYGKFFPEYIREKIMYFLISHIEITLEVKK